MSVIEKTKQKQCSEQSVASLPNYVCSVQSFEIDYKLQACPGSSLKINGANRRIELQTCKIQTVEMEKK